MHTSSLKAWLRSALVRWVGASPLDGRGQGQGLVEYALILVLVVLIVIIVIYWLGPWVGNVFSNVIFNL